MTMRTKPVVAGAVLAGLLAAAGVGATLATQTTGGENTTAPTVGQSPESGFGLADLSSLAEDGDVGGPGTPETRAEGTRLPDADPVTAEDVAAAKRTVAVHRQVVEEVVPSRGTTEVLVAPAGADWWAAVSSLAAPLDLDGAPSPDQATWVAYSAGQSFSDSTGLAPHFDAVYAGFADADAAAAFLDRVHAASGGSDRYAYLRGNVVTVVPAGVYPEQETFPAEAPQIDVPKALTRGAWQVDWFAKAKVVSAGNEYREAYLRMWQALGFAETGAAWSATAPRPEGPWLGTVAGFTPETASADAAGQAILDSGDRVCHETRDGDLVTETCLQTDRGLEPLLSAVRLADASGAVFGAFEDPTRHGDAARLTVAFDPDVWWGQATGSGARYETPLAAVSFDVDDQSRMVVRLHLEG